MARPITMGFITTIADPYIPNAGGKDPLVELFEIFTKGLKEAFDRFTSAVSQWFSRNPLIGRVTKQSSEVEKPHLEKVKNLFPDYSESIKRTESDLLEFGVQKRETIKPFSGCSEPTAAAPNGVPYIHRAQGLPEIDESLSPHYKKLISGVIKKYLKEITGQDDIEALKTCLADKKGDLYKRALQVSAVLGQVGDNLQSLSGANENAHINKVYDHNYIAMPVEHGVVITYADIDAEGAISLEVSPANIEIYALDEPTVLVGVISVAQSIKVLPADDEGNVVCLIDRKYDFSNFNKQ